MKRKYVSVLGLLAEARRLSVNEMRGNERGIVRDDGTVVSEYGKPLFVSVQPEAVHPLDVMRQQLAETDPDVVERRMVTVERRLKAFGGETGFCLEMPYFLELAWLKGRAIEIGDGALEEELWDITEQMMMLYAVTVKYMSAGILDQTENGLMDWLEEGGFLYEIDDEDVEADVNEKIRSAYFAEFVPFALSTETQTNRMVTKWFALPASSMDIMHIGAQIHNCMNSRSYMSVDRSFYSQFLLYLPFLLTFVSLEKEFCTFKYSDCKSYEGYIGRFCDPDEAADGNAEGYSYACAPMEYLYQLNQLKPSKDKELVLAVIRWTMASMEELADTGVTTVMMSKLRYYQPGEVIPGRIRILCNADELTWERTE